MSDVNLPAGGVHPPDAGASLVVRRHSGGFTAVSGGYPAVSGGYPAVARDGDEISLGDIWHLLHRHRWMILAFLAAGAGLAASYAAWTTPIYQAGASVMIEAEQSSLPVLDALKDMGEGSELASHIEVLRSRSLARSVVDSLALQVTVTKPRSALRGELLSVQRVSRTAPTATFILEREAGGFRVAGGDGRIHAPGDRMTLGGAEIVLQPAALAEPEIGITVQRYRTAVDGLMSRMSVSRPSRDANLVLVRYQGTEPDVVQEVPNVLAHQFIVAQEALTKTEARSTVQFLHGQIGALKEQLEEAEDSLRAFRQRAGVVSLTDEASSEVQRLAALRAERASIDAERSALAALLADVQATARSASPDVPSPYRRLLAFPTLLRNQAISQQLASLNALEDERATLLMRRTVRDPDVMTLASRIHDMEEQIRVLATTYLQGLSNQVASIDTELAAFRVQLAQVPEREVEFARLTRESKVLESVYVMLQSRLKEAEIAQAVEDPGTRVVDAAMLPESPLQPNTPLVVLMGGMLGLMGGVGAAFVRRNMDHTVQSRDDIQRVTGLPVLGVIPHVDLGQGKRYTFAGSRLRRVAMATSGPGEIPEPGEAFSGRSGPTAAPALATRLIAGNDPRNPAAEAYRTLRTNLTFARIEGTPRTVVFTSPMPGDGKSTTSSNLAITLGQQGRRVLLVDADLRRGVLDTVFNRSGGPGLSNLIVGGAELAEAIHTVPLACGGSIDFLPTGTLPPNPAELLGSGRMDDLLAELEQRYDLVILDSPPLNVVTDAALLGTNADGVVVVTRAGTTTLHDLEYGMHQLANVRAPVLGVVLNDVAVGAGARYGYASFEAYTYQHGSVKRRASQDEDGTRPLT